MKNTIMVLSDYDNIQEMNACVSKHISGPVSVHYGYRNRIEYCFLKFEDKEDAVTFKMMFEGE